VHVHQGGVRPRFGAGSRVVALLALLIAPFPAQAQRSSCADSVARAIGAFRGEWQVRAVFRISATAQDTTEARAVLTPELGGCVLREDYRGRRYGEPYEFLALWGANGGADAPIQRFFVHSQHGIFGVASGAFRADTLVLREQNTVAGSPVLQEKLFSRPASGQFVQVDRRSTDGGATWTVTLRAEYRQRGP
jgi:hypothetical protein